MVPVVDARRSPRVRLRAPAMILFRGARYDVVVEDIGANGCQLTSTFPLRRGEAVHLTVLLRGPSDVLSANATVAWSLPTPPYRTGLSFARAGAAERARRLQEIVDRDPALALPPSPLRPGMRLGLGPAPAPGMVLGRDDLAVLRAARDGATALALLEAAGPRHREVRSALETLRARGLVLDGLSGTPAPGWRGLLGVEPFAPAPPEPVTNPLAPAGRPVRAVCFLETARHESAHGHLGAAVEWLQLALAAAPDDAEISDALEALTLGDGGLAGSRRAAR